MTTRRLITLAVLALGTAARAAAVPCPGAAALVIAADNRSADGSLALAVSGERVASAGECDNGPTGFATTYATTLACTGSGAVKCGSVTGLAPGLWVHRVSVQVAGSALQEQASRAIVVGGSATNVVEWTVFGKTLVVTQPSGSELLAALDAAALYTGGSPHPALVRFDRSAFPGAAMPQTIAVKHHLVQPGNQHVCEADDTCSDGRKTAYCFEGSHVTVDGLDDDGLAGGVELDVGTCQRSLLRLYGGDDVLRGLVLRGGSNASPTIPVDTIAITGAAARRDRLEQCTIVGPTDGDAVSVETDAGQPDGGPAPENAVVASEVRGAEDKGIKVVDGGVVRIERSCVHDNANGGVQLTKSNPAATLGGTAVAVENVVQHNVGGDAENGFFSGVPEDASVRHALTTLGNVVRFNGARGISVVNAADASLASDVVSDNYRAGLRVETTRSGIRPTVEVRGGGFACNYAAGLCQDDMTRACRVNEDCVGMQCVPGAGSPLAVDGVGAALDTCSPGCLSPTVDLGLGGTDAGRNAFALNANPDGGGAGGVNLSTTLVLADPVAAAGNQWEHCDTPLPDPINPNRCNVTQVAMLDVRIGNGATPVSLGTPTGPRHGPNPVVSSISPARPRAGDLVRVYGGSFNAIDAAACQPAGLPSDPCSAENPAVASANANDLAHGNEVTVTLGGMAFPAEVHQVTPSMLVFKMPVDCFAPGTLTVARGSDVGAPVVVCDPIGCGDRAVGAVCDDGDLCTDGDGCRADGSCGGTPRSCDDSNPCTVDACDPATGCTHADRPDGASCVPTNLCLGVGSCAGGTCDPGGPVSCDDGHACTDDGCDPATGCLHVARTDLAGVTCHPTQLRALTDALAFVAAKAARRIGARIGCIEQRIAAAGKATAGSRPRTRQVKKALRCVDRFEQRVRRVPDVDATSRAGLLDEAEATRAAIASYFGTP